MMSFSPKNLILLTCSALGVLPSMSKLTTAQIKVINPLRNPDQEPVYIGQMVAENMKPYQLGGVLFLWRELTGDLDKAYLGVRHHRAGGLQEARRGHHRA